MLTIHDFELQSAMVGGGMIGLPFGPLGSLTLAMLSLHCKKYAGGV